jgi:hypothetical protein
MVVVRELSLVRAQGPDRARAADHPMGPHASKLRQSARCTRCGHRGATLQAVSWGGMGGAYKEWPADQSSARVEPFAGQRVRVAGQQLPHALDLPAT